MKTILYTKNFNQKINEKVNIILSPEFYWIKKIDIKIDSLSTAKKIAKNIFKLDNSYKFDAIKLDNKYFAIAFKKNLKIDIENRFINSITIAQIEFYNYDCIKIDNNNYLQKIDDIIFFFRENNECKNNLYTILQNIHLSNYNLPINKIELNKTTIFTTLFLFLSLNSFFLIQNYKYSTKSNEIEHSLQQLIVKNSLPPTTFQLKSILNDLQKEYNKQIALRKTLQKLSNLNIKCNSIEYNKGVISLKCKKNIVNSLKNSFNIIDSKFKKNVYCIRLKI